jgi:MSHA biogenesis protein MshN
MSLINEMLRNLEARGAGARPQSAPPLEPAVADAPRARRGRMGAALCLAALTGAALALVWLGPLELPAPAPNVASLAARADAIGQTPALPEVSQAPAFAPSPDAAVVVRRVELEPTEHGTRLALELSAQTAHSVARSDGGRALEVVLSDTRLGAQIPPLDLQRSPIESLDVEQRGADLHLVLGLAGPARVQSGMQPADDGARLSLDFSGVPPAAPASAAEPERDRVPPPPAAAKPQAEPAPLLTPRALGPAERATRMRRRALDAAAAGDHAGAESTLEAALELDPALHDARSDLARLRLARGDAAAALAALEGSAPLLAQDPEYHALHAALLSRTGAHARAADAYARLVALDRTRAPWWLGLAISLEAQSRAPDALAAYREAARLTSLDPETQSWVESRIAALAPGS